MRMIVMFLLLVSQAQALGLPEYERITLDNGLVLLLMSRNDVPVVTVRVLIRGGSESDPEGLGGLAHVTAELLRRGTTEKNADEFSQEVDYIGAQFNATANRQATSVSISTLAKDSARGIELLAEALTSPAFSENEVRKSIDQAVDAARALKDEPDRAIEPYFQSLLFSTTHPYAHYAQGDELSLPRITREHVIGYHRGMYVGRNLIIAVAGDFDASQMESQLVAAFGNLPAGDRYQGAKDEPQRGKARLLLVDKPGATQTYFIIGHVGITRTHRERVAISLVNTLFGNQFTSMLNDELRVNSGLTYGASSFFDLDRLTGAFGITSFTKTESTVQAIDRTLEVLQRLRNAGISEQQLNAAKAYLKGTFPPRNMETARQLADLVGDLELFGLDNTEIDELFHRIDAVTVDRANEDVRQYFGSAPLCFALVGDAVKIREAVTKYASQVLEVAISDPGFSVRK